MRSVSFAACEALIPIHTCAYAICSVCVLLASFLMLSSNWTLVLVVLARTSVLATQKTNQNVAAAACAGAPLLRRDTSKLKRKKETHK